MSKIHSYSVSFAAATLQVEAANPEAAEEAARLELKDRARCAGVVYEGEADELGGDSIED